MAFHIIFLLGSNLFENVNEPILQIILLFLGFDRDFISLRPQVQFLLSLKSLFNFFLYEAFCYNNVFICSFRDCKRKGLFITEEKS